MKENGQTNRNAAETVHHAYILSRGILHCGRCGTVMDGRSGTGRLGTKYFYYVCTNKECGLRVSAAEVETAVLQRIKYLIGNGDLLQRLTQETNVRLLSQKPALEKRRQALLKSLVEIKSQADGLLEHWSSLEEQAGNSFVKDKLNGLARRRVELETGIGEADEALRQIYGQSVKVDDVKNMLARMDEVYAQLKPFERRELMSLVLKSAKVNEREIVLEIYALVQVHAVTWDNAIQGEKVHQPLIWLPD